MSQTINVVGAGIAGSIVTRLLRKHGFDVRVFDDNDPYAGSRASSNLYIASWLKKFGSERAKKGIDVLESIIPQKHIDQPFSKGIADALKVRHIAQRHLLVEPDVQEQVTWFQDGTVRLNGNREYPGRAVVLCQGYRAQKVDVLVGHCLLIKGRLQPGQSSLTMPLPYKHAKLYQYDEDRIYFANSTGLKLSSFEKRSAELKEKLIKQAEEALGRQLKPGEDYEYRVGYRPIVHGHDFGVCERLDEHTWSINGGGKNGLVAYAYQAAKLLEELKR